MAKLVDVARAAGVSRGTASNVFAHPELVRPELRRRVEDAARDLGYGGPDPKGRILRAGKVNAIGVVPFGNFGVTHAVANPFFRMFLEGVARVCDEAGANLVVIGGSADGGHGIRNALVDGFILARIEDIRHIEPARRRDLPFVVMDLDLGPDTNTVRLDARSGCRAAAEHLLQLGHRRFAIMSFMRERRSAVLHPSAPGRPAEIAGAALDQEKMAGYAEALAAAGIDPDTIPVVQAEPWDTVATAMLLDAAPDATAILSMSDMQAISLAEEARRRGRSVPRDLSIIGFNNIPEGVTANPPLTTVDGMGVERGRRAAEVLLAGGPPVQHVIASKLVVRESTAIAPR